MHTLEPFSETGRTSHPTNRNGHRESNTEGALELDVQDHRPAPMGKIALRNLGRREGDR